MIYDLSTRLLQQHQHNVVAIGNFDAVHRGHQALLEIARKRALHLGKPFGVLTFEPHPRSIFKPNDPPFRITPQAVKQERLQQSGVDFIVSMPFTSNTAHIAPQNFINDILLNYLKTHTIICGADFHFGHNRTGSVHDIEQAGIHTIIVNPLADAMDQIYSATRIRTELKNGNIINANALLGWDYFIRGDVQHGDKRGRTIDFPTANVSLDEYLCPAHGVYAAQIRHKNNLYKGAVNIGVRPTFALQKPQLEAHIFDFNADIYNHTIDVILKEKIRDEMKCESLEQLKQQLKQDCIIIKERLKHL